MNQQSSTRSAIVRWHARIEGPGSIERLVVLLPDEDIDEPALANTLWRLASRSQAAVHIIAATGGWAGESRVVLRVAMLTALLRESGINGTAELIEEADWLAVARKVYTCGDALVCFVEQMLPDSFNSFSVQFKPLSHFLAAQRMPVCELDGLTRRRTPLKDRHLAAWALPLIVIAVSFVLQVIFVRLADSWATWIRNLALIAYSTVEIISVAWLADS